MKETLLFPGLGLEFELSRWLSSWGRSPCTGTASSPPLPSPWGCSNCYRKARSFGVDPDKIVDLILVTVLLGVVCARIYYVVFSWDQYKDDLMSVFRTWEGVSPFTAGHRRADWHSDHVQSHWHQAAAMLDLAVAPLILGQAIGRWGNFVNIEAFGCNTTLPWGMTGPAIVNYLASHQKSLAEIGVVVDPTQPVPPNLLLRIRLVLPGLLDPALPDPPPPV